MANNLLLVSLGVIICIAPILVMSNTGTVLGYKHHKLRLISRVCFCVGLLLIAIAGFRSLSDAVAFQPTIHPVANRP